MLVAILSDIHANLAALQAVLTHIKEEVPGRHNGRQVGELWIAGDVVGYGPSPAACIRALVEVEVPVRLVAGNHEELLLLPRIPMEEVRAQPEAIAAIDLHKVDLRGTEELRWLQQKLSRPLTGESVLAEDRVVYEWEGDTYELVWKAEVQMDPFYCTLSHGSLIPRMGYIFPSELTPALEEAWRTRDAVTRSLRLLRERHGPSAQVCLFVGHSHAASLWHVTDNPGGEHLEEQRFMAGEAVRLQWAGSLINVGSVGAARGDAGYAHYVILDSDAATIELQRVPYKWRVTDRELVNWWRTRHGGLRWNDPHLMNETSDSIFRRLRSKVCQGDLRQGGQYQP